MTRASKTSAASYQGDPDVWRTGPAWAWRLGGVLAYLVAGLMLLALIAHWLASPGDTWPPKNPMGPPGAWTAALIWEMWGLAGFWAPAVLIFMGWQIWTRGNPAALYVMAGGGVWLLTACAGLLGASGIMIGPSRLPLGGSGGAAIAQGLASSLGPVWAWLIPGALTAVGVGLFAWATWPLIMTAVKYFSPAPQAREEEPAPWAARVEPEPEPAPRSSSQAPAIPAKRSADEGPLIRPRSSLRAEEEHHRQEKLSLIGGPFRRPSLDLLRTPPPPAGEEQADSLRRNSVLVAEKLADFGVKGEVVEVAPGPVVTMYEFKPAPGVKISKVAGLADDLAMNLRASSIRIVAPIPGKAVIGIEIPSSVREMVFLREILGAGAYTRENSALTVAMGKDILGSPVVYNLAKMPHLLVAGATGAGKSVFINTMVLSILFKTSPKMVRLIMIDPKRIELSTYNDIPHLLHPIITDPREATSGLRWAVKEMERRYELLAEYGVRNISSFNKRIKVLQKGKKLSPNGDSPETLPYLVIIIDELSDLMMVASKEVEALITRLAQMARAAGIHLVLATQRPSVDVITGLIKANFPARLSFKVSSRADSRVILDEQGAEHLLGMGDMLFKSPGAMGTQRIHGAFVSDREIEEVVRFLKKQAAPKYDTSVVEPPEDSPAGGIDLDVDEFYAQAVALVKSSGSASISRVQRVLKVGYNRAARMIEQMEADGIVGPSEGSKPRKVLISD